MAALLAAGCASAPAPPPSPPASSTAPEVAWWPPEPVTDRWYPVAALITPTGETVIAETRQNRLFRLGRPDAPPERLATPSGGVVEWTALAAAPGLSFYALDGPGLSVHQYDLNGNYLGRALDLARAADLAGLGSINPGGLAVASSGQAVISDRRGDRLLVFGPGWEFLTVWGQSGLSIGSWRHPGAVAAAPDGKFLVADQGNRRAVLLDPLGGVVSSVDVDDVPQGVAVLDRGRFAVALPNAVLLLGRGLEPVASWPAPRGAGCTGTPYFTGAVAGDRQGVLVGEGCSGRLARWSAPGG